jgi:hypothetical protein
VKPINRILSLTPPLEERERETDRLNHCLSPSTYLSRGGGGSPDLPTAPIGWRLAQNRYIDLAQDCTFFSRPPPVCHGFPRLLLEIWSIVSVGVGTSSVGECERRAQFDESFTPRCNGEDSFRQRTRAPRAGSFEPPSTQAAANARPTSAVYSPTSRSASRNVGRFHVVGRRSSQAASPVHVSVAG